MGMGGSFCAVADDANAIFWNPAGLPHLKNYEFTSTYLNFYGLDVASQLIGQVGRFSSIAIGLGYLRTGEMGLYIEENVLIPLGIMLPDSFAEKVGYNRISIGFTPKLFRKSYGGYDVDNPILRNQSSINVFSLDAGLLCRYKGLRIGAMIENVINPNMALSDEDELKIPRLYRVGASLNLEDLLKFNLNLSVEGVRRDVFIETQDSIRAGLELQSNYASFFTIRSGALTDKEMNLKGFAGMGLDIGPVQLDYALCYQEIFGYTHRVSLSLALGNRPPSPLKPWERALKEGISLYRANKINESIRKFIELFKLTINDAKLSKHALEKIEKALTYDSSSPRFDVVIGSLYLAIKEDIKAESMFEQALRKDESFELPSVMGEKVEILWYSVKGKLLSTKFYKKYYGEGTLANAKGDYKTAIQQWKVALLWNLSFEKILRTKISDAYTNWLSGEFETPEQKQAVENQQRAYELLKKGYTDYRNGKLELAIYSFEGCLSLDPTLTEAYKWLGCIYARQGKKEDAADAFRKALSLQADFILIGDVPKEALKIFRTLKIED